MGTARGGGSSHHAPGSPGSDFGGLSRAWGPCVQSVRAAVVWWRLRLHGQGARPQEDAAAPHPLRPPAKLASPTLPPSPAPHPPRTAPQGDGLPPWPGTPALDSTRHPWLAGGPGGRRAGPALASPGVDRSEDFGGAKGATLVVTRPTPCARCGSHLQGGRRAWPPSPSPRHSTLRQPAALWPVDQGALEARPSHGAARVGARRGHWRPRSARCP